MITILYSVVRYLLVLMTYAIFLSAIVSMLISFNVLDSRNRFVWSVADFLFRVTDPVIRPIRRVLPTMGNLDFSPWAALLLIQLVAIPLLDRIYGAITANTLQPLIY